MRKLCELWSRGGADARRTAPASALGEFRGQPTAGKAHIVTRRRTRKVHLRANEQIHAPCTMPAAPCLCQAPKADNGTRSARSIRKIDVIGLSGVNRRPTRVIHGTANATMSGPSVRPQKGVQGAGSVKKEQVNLRQLPTRLHRTLTEGRRYGRFPAHHRSRLACPGTARTRPSLPR
jgi:hypothetical protein